MNTESVQQQQHQHHLRTQVLIVDDDIDSALRVEAIFHHLG
ncbi:MAG TPA: hypothetical protein VIG33_11635 [Pseudobdellovibrionaceae bacterium]|jgi:thiamine monophosphate synthase